MWHILTDGRCLVLGLGVLCLRPKNQSAMDLRRRTIPRETIIAPASLDVALLFALRSPREWRKCRHCESYSVGFAGINEDQGGFGEPTVFKQTFLRRNVLVPNRLWYNIRTLAHHVIWEGGNWSLTMSRSWPAKSYWTLDRSLCVWPRYWLGRLMLAVCVYELVL